MTSSLQSQLLRHLEVVACPRHLHWHCLGLLAVRSYLSQELSALGPVEMAAAPAGSASGRTWILPELGDLGLDRPGGGEHADRSA